MATSRSVLGWLRLMRLPNVFTAIADIAMGFVFVRHSLQPWGAFAMLAAASAMLYTAGMILNDVFDFDIDTRERPERPLPSGQIPLPLARAIGFTLLGLGVLFSWGAGLIFASETVPAIRAGLIATALAASVLFYNTWLKRTPAGPLGMGLCRFLNVLLGMSLVAAPLDWMLGYGPEHLLAAAGIAVYIVGVTWFARSEATDSQKWQLTAAMGVMAAGIILLGSCAMFLPAVRTSHTAFWVLLGLLMVTVLRRCGAAVADPSPGNVQTAVKHSILSLIWLDAAVCLALAHPGYAIGVAALLIPTLILGRWVYST